MHSGTPGAPRLSRLSRGGRSYRVAIVAPCPFPSLRGSQVLIRELAERLVADGHEAHVVTYPTAQHLVPVGPIAIHRTARVRGLWTSRPLGWQKLWLDLLLVCLLYRVVRRERIEVIHAHNVEGPLVALIVRWLTGVPVVYHAHNALTDELPCYAKRRVGRWLARGIGSVVDRWLARTSDFTIALSDRLGAFLAMRGAAGRVAVIPPGSSGLRPWRRRPATSRPGFVVMYAGNLDPYQDLNVLLDGFARVRAAEAEARLVFVTHPAAGRSSTRVAAALRREPGVELLTAPTFRAAARKLSQADVVVCPRGSWSGFPIKALNYLGLGLPIVHARASAHPIEHEINGLLFDDGDARALADAVLRVRREPGLAEGLRVRAERSAADYGWGQVLPRILAVYGGLAPLFARGGGRSPGGAAEKLNQPLMKFDNARIKSLVHRGRSGFVTRGVSFLMTCVLGAGLLTGCAPKRPSEVAPLPPLSGVTSEAKTLLPYRLAPGDVLRVKFLYHPELDVRVPVREDGKIDIQGVGEVVASGKTAMELAKEIQDISSGHLRDPDVTVIVAELGQRKVYVGGEVRVPGFVAYRDGLTPLQAILDRGGFTDVARSDSVLKLTLKGDRYESTRLDLKQTIKEGVPETTLLAVNDVIFVPRTFIGDADSFVLHWFKELNPIQPRAGLGIGITP